MYDYLELAFGFPKVFQSGEEIYYEWNISGAKIIYEDIHETILFEANKEVQYFDTLSLGSKDKVKIIKNIQKTI